MKNDIYFKNIWRWGNLCIDHIFVAFEAEPILFTCINERNDLYLVLCNEIRAEYRWLIVPISTYGLRMLIEKKEDLFTAFYKNEVVVIVTMDYDGNERYKKVSKDTIDNIELPESGLYLRCNERDALEYLDRKLNVARFNVVIQKKFVECRYITEEKTKLMNVVDEDNGYKKVGFDNNFNKRVTEDSFYETRANAKYRSSFSDSGYVNLEYMYFDAA